jgi:hypothetical protein
MPHIGWLGIIVIALVLITWIWGVINLLKRSPTKRFLQMAWDHYHPAGDRIYPVFYGWTEENYIKLKSWHL